MPNALRFRQWKTPKQAGERARLKVVHGPDSGALFVVTATKFTIGRGEENDVVIGDLRASRRHAELARQPSGTWHLSDLGSQNGVVWNGKITREADLRPGDVVTVGETAFEFVPEESGTQMLSSPPKAISTDHLAGRASLNPAPNLPAAVPAPSPVPAMPSALAGLQMPTAGDAAALQGITGLGAGAGVDGGAAEKRKKTIRIVLGLVLVAALAYDPPKETAPKDKKAAMAKAKAAKEKKDLDRELASFLPPLPATGPQAAAETFFQEGFREFRERNYLRARVQFETALQINPSHSGARSYLQLSESGITEEVRLHLERGRRDFDAGKLRSARAHFEAVMRLLYRDVENESYIEARDQLTAVKERLKRGGFDS
ncbi:MAG: FHA domain-containing protein [Bdellovibrionales bacterium]|nr:FHA domain-containing protein [Bdellovibrionales bacterium]